MKTHKFDITARLVTPDKMTTLTTNCVSFVSYPDSIMQKINTVIFDWAQRIRTKCYFSIIINTYSMLCQIRKSITCKIYYESIISTNKKSCILFELTFLLFLFKYNDKYNRLIYINPTTVLLWESVLLLSFYL